MSRQGETDGESKGEEIVGEDEYHAGDEEIGIGNGDGNGKGEEYDDDDDDDDNDAVVKVRTWRSDGDERNGKHEKAKTATDSCTYRGIGIPRTCNANVASIPRAKMQADQERSVPLALDQMVELLAQDPRLIQLVEQGLASLIETGNLFEDTSNELDDDHQDAGVDDGEDDRKLPAVPPENFGASSVDTRDVSRRVVRTILGGEKNANGAADGNEGCNSVSRGCVRSNRQRITRKTDPTAEGEDGEGSQREPPDWNRFAPTADVAWSNHHRSALSPSFLLDYDDEEGDCPYCGNEAGMNTTGRRDQSTDRTGNGEASTEDGRAPSSPSLNVTTSVFRTQRRPSRTSRSVGTLGQHMNGSASDAGHRAPSSRAVGKSSSLRPRGRSRAHTFDCQAAPPLKSVSFSSASAPGLGQELRERSVSPATNQGTRFRSLSHEPGAARSPIHQRRPHARALLRSRPVFSDPFVGGGTSSTRSSPTPAFPPSPMRSRFGRSDRSGSRSPMSAFATPSRAHAYYNSRHPPPPPHVSATSSVTSAQTGEATEEDSSVASYHTNVSHGLAGAVSPHQVHFSAMNPNPRILRSASRSTSSVGAYVADSENDDEEDEEADDDRTRRSGFASLLSTAQSGGGGVVGPPVPRVTFTLDRSVSWEDQLRTLTGGYNTATSTSRASYRSGLSSPSIEPALSPPLSRSRSPVQIQFNSTTEVITEAAARLRRQQREGRIDGVAGDDDEGTEAGEGSVGGVFAGAATGGSNISRPSPRVVHFSAMRDVAVVDVDAAAATSLNSGSIAVVGAAATSPAAGESNDGLRDAPSGGRATPTSPASQSAPVPIGGLSPGSTVTSGGFGVHFADDLGDPEDGLNNLSYGRMGGYPIPGHSEAEMERVAERLRRLIRRAEQVGNVTLEGAFAHFDRSHTGIISPSDLQEGLATLGESFTFSIDECSALIECLSHSEGRLRRPLGNRNGISLLGFYRAMGRKSPPLFPTAARTGEGGVPFLRLGRPFSERSEGNTEDFPNEEVGADDSTSFGPNPREILERHVQATHSTSSLFRTSGTMNDLASSPVVHAHDAATRLREIVLSAERENGTPLERSFRLLDPSGSGYVTARDFFMGLRRLGGSQQSSTSRADENDVDEDRDEGEFFSRIDDADCEELVALFDANNDGLVSLLDFYRFMGRRSPPPPLGDVDEGSGTTATTETAPAGDGVGDENDEGQNGSHVSSRHQQLDGGCGTSEDES